MRPMFALLTILMLYAISSVRAQEPAKAPEVEKIPAPQPLILPAVPSVPFPEPARPGTRDIWRAYGVDSFGRFRPRVIMTPYGSYYMQSAQPYPWTASKSSRFMPYVAD